ncbi:MAG: hypothetical protein ACLTXT_02485 [Ruminococcus callidus]
MKNAVSHFKGKLWINPDCGLKTRGIRKPFPAWYIWYRLQKNFDNTL